jgi:hypothetical protein
MRVRSLAIFQMVAEGDSYGTVQLWSIVIWRNIAPGTR